MIENSNAVIWLFEFKFGSIFWRTITKERHWLNQKLFGDILFRFFVSLMYIVGKIAEKVTKRSCDQFEVTAKLAIGSKKQLVLIRKYQTGQVKVRSLNVFFSSMLLQIIIYWKVNYWGQARMVKKTRLQFIPNERGKSFRIDLKSSRISNKYKFEIFSSHILGVQEVPAFRDFCFQRAIMKCGDHEFWGLFLV